MVQYHGKAGRIMRAENPCYVCSVVLHVHHRLDCSFAGHACRFVQVLVALLSGATSGLAGAAADVLAEIVLKRMDAAAKLRCALFLLATSDGALLAFEAFECS